MADKLKMTAIREQFPMYGDLSDEDLAMAIRQKYYADIPAQRFYNNIDFDTPAAIEKREKAAASKYYNAGGSKTLSDLIAPDRVKTDVSELPWYERLAGGGKVAWDRAAYGLKNVFTDLTPEEKELLEGGKAFVNQGGAAAKTGEIGTEIGMTAVPGYRAQQAISRGVQVASQAPAVSSVLRHTMSSLGRGAAPYAGAAGSGAMVGAVMSPEDAVGGAQMGAAAGVAGELGGKVLAAGYNGAKAVLDPLTEKGRDRILKRTIERFATDPNKVRQTVNAASDVTVPGRYPSLPAQTLAEATMDPGIAQLQRGAAAASPDVASALAEARGRQIAGYRGTLDEMAGNDGKREFFDAAREAAAQKQYGRAWAEGLQTNSALDATAAELMQRPSMQRAIQQAKLLAKERGVDIANPAGSVSGLHYAKQALDDMISSAKRAGNNNEVSALMDTKEKLVGYLSEASPAYGEAMNTFREMSRPINQMDIAQTLRDKAIPALGDLGDDSLARVNANSYANALRNADQTARSSTGMRGATMEKVLDPDQLRAVQGIGEDMSRYAAAQELGRVPGSPTAQYMGAQNVIRQFLGPLGLPQSAADSMVGRIASGALSLPFKMTQSQTEQLLARALTDPKVAAKILAAKDPKTIADLLRPYAAQAAIQIDTQ